MSVSLVNKNMETQNNSSIIKRTRFSNKEKFITQEEKQKREKENKALIENFLNTRDITQCEPRWAIGASNMSLFGTEV